MTRNKISRECPEQGVFIFFLFQMHLRREELMRIPYEELNPDANSRICIELNNFS